MSPRYARLSVPTLLAVAGLAVAGCGGDKGGDETAYVQTYESACKSVSTAGTDFQRSVASIAQSAQKDPQGAVTKLKAGVTKVFDTFGRELQTMADADAPEKWQDFQKSVADNAKKGTDGIEQAKAAVQQVKSPQDFSKLSTVFDKIDIGDGTKGMPKELQDKAPSCKSLSSGAKV